jgi:hypothetical protein
LNSGGPVLKSAILTDVSRSFPQPLQLNDLIINYAATFFRVFSCSSFTVPGCVRLRREVIAAKELPHSQRRWSSCHISGAQHGAVMCIRSGGACETILGAQEVCQKMDVRMLKKEIKQGSIVYCLFMETR